MHSPQNQPSEYISRHRAWKSLYYFCIWSLLVGQNVKITHKFPRSAYIITLLYHEWISEGLITSDSSMKIGLNHGDCSGIVHVQCACKWTNTVCIISAGTWLEKCMICKSMVERFVSSVHWPSGVTADYMHPFLPNISPPNMGMATRILSLNNEL